ncbi:endonuclease MutS2 [Liquorilactobacillus cacaonum]|uniref:Endonuclease MutS2 n=1 Tax=Liquorilactobacillus cacaonum DSM 21116 TaxID=1423729 RepID=A0A0R2CG46_9LACO|nr:endonuclease MutS2 [Liquorilactobacillus cacaonum]KRM90282.1 DNA mismatch repair protein [Liquorilactobacillus cacaonum DSM 21116]
MNSKTLKTLEFDKVKNNLLSFVGTPMGKKRVVSLEPSSDLDEVSHQIAQTKDGVDILRVKGGIPVPKLADISQSLKRLDINATLNGKELAAISKILRATNEVRDFFVKLDDAAIKLTTLDELADDLQVLPTLNKRLLLSIEGDGHVTDEASATLAGIRKSITSIEGQLRDQLNVLIHGTSSKYLSDAVVTIRNDRYVIPVKQEYRNHFGGVVHDQSASGQTLFIEPRQIVDLNNHLKQQQANEKEEIARILRELSELIAPYTAEIRQNAHLLGIFDFINAKAKYAKQINATEPMLSLENKVYLRQGWHPLLDMKKAVKNDIMLGDDYKAIVVTGPNTGGKTITLKTLGLIQLMGQAGLFIPAFEESRIGIFSDIFADIGDEQSIEQSLSTFSSHMTNIVDILAEIDEKALVLFDELGAGTDPQEGAALAISILDYVGSKGSYVIATTHYPELKAYGFERPQTINASMEFDVESLRPTYRLLLGIPGRSNALEISKRLGLEEVIVMQAKQLTAGQNQDLNDMIQDLVSKRHQVEEESIEVHQNLEESQKLHHDLEKKYEELANQREQLLDNARKRSNEIVEQATQKAEKIITQLRQMRLNSGKSIKENELIEAKAQLNKLEQPTNLRKNRVLRRAKQQQAFKPNDDVLVKSYGQRGVLLRKAGEHEWEVQLGILKMKVQEAELEKIKVEENSKKAIRTSVKSVGAVHVSPTLDLRGERYEEALVKADRYLDAAVLAGYASVTIIHGKGTGALRQGITDFLAQSRVVKSFKFSAPNAGGNGSTIVYLK